MIFQATPNQIYISSDQRNYYKKKPCYEQKYNISFIICQRLTLINNNELSQILHFGHYIQLTNEIRFRGLIQEVHPWLLVAEFWEMLRPTEIWGNGYEAMVGFWRAVQIQNR